MTPSGQDRRGLGRWRPPEAERPRRLRRPRSRRIPNRKRRNPPRSRRRRRRLPPNRMPPSRLRTLRGLQVPMLRTRWSRTPRFPRPRTPTDPAGPTAPTGPGNETQPNVPDPTGPEELSIDTDLTSRSIQEKDLPDGQLAFWVKAVGGTGREIIRVTLRNSATPFNGTTLTSTDGLHYQAQLRRRNTTPSPCM